MPNKLVVFLTGILGALASLVLLYIMIKSVFNKNFYIRINPEGLYLGIIQYSNKLIYWKDITGVTVAQLFFLENSFQKHKILTSLEAILERFIF